MRTKQRLGLFWITTFFFISATQAQITFVNPPADTIVTCNNLITFPDDIDLEDDCPGNAFTFWEDESTRVFSTDTCAFYRYTIFRTFSAMNSCGDTSLYVQTITVIDSVAPTFVVPPAVTVNCNDLDNLDLTGNVTEILDECGGPATTTYIDETKPIRCDSTITRTWIVTDVCGNSRTDTQLITVVDDTPPFFINPPRDLSISCDMTDNPYPVFNDWVDNLGFGNYDDACNQVQAFFAAVPGSYDLQDATTFPGEHPGGLNLPECGVIEGAVQFETVDFVIVDNCGNAHASPATFYYTDDVNPTLENCPENITVTLDGSDCTTTLTYDIPVATDSCAFEDLELTFSDIKEVSSLQPGDSTIVVNDVTIRLGLFGPEIPFEEENFFNVSLNNIDGENTGETFLIFDENDELIGLTPNTDSQCGTVNFEIGPFTRDKASTWAEDGYIHFTFKASENEDPSESINDLCGESTIEVSQTYVLRQAVDSVQMYLGINELPFEAITGSTADIELNAGIHIVKFMAVDCAGNSTTCPQTVTILDTTNPQLNCGVSRQVDTDEGVCGFTLPLSEIALINNPCQEDIDIRVEVQGSMNTLLSGDYESMKDSIVLFPTGSFIVNVEATDFSDNSSSCTFNLEVQDNEAPTAICNDTIVGGVAIALEDLRVDPNLLAGNSFDNCGIASMTIEDNTFECADLGANFTKTVIITDASNNTSSCLATFRVEPADIPITYTVGICPEDSLKFQLNIPIRDEYVYDWDGPLGFSSVVAEPFIPAVQAVHEGIYTLIARNVLTGCESTASIEVFIEDIKTPNLYTEEIGCETVPHVLRTDPVPGENIRYDWYEFIGTTRSLITSSDSAFVEIPLEPGDYVLGVAIVNSFCESRTSDRIEVEIRERPDGAICTNLIEGCIGQPLALCVEDPEEQFIVRWTGPNGFESNEASPLVTDSFFVAFSGVYKVVIEDNMCITDTLTTSVTTNITPPKPEILGDFLYCPGETLELTSSIVEEEYIYVWQSPSGTIRNDDSTLEIPNFTTNFNGEWRLSIENGPCTSVMSDPVIIDLEPLQTFEITTNPVQCQGAEVVLNASDVPGSVYQWSGPNGFTSNEKEPMLDIIQGTYAASITTPNGCIYLDEQFINTITIPDVIGVEVSHDESCIFPGTAVTIIPVLTESSDIFYEWVGPNSSSTSSTLTIEDFSEEDNGVYGVKVLNGACESELFTFPLLFTVSPDKPVIDADPVACIGNDLNLVIEDYGPEAIYKWITPLDTITSASNELLLENVMPDLTGTYYVEVTIGECTSEQSDGLDILVNDNIFVPTILTSGEECLQSEFKLSTELSADLEIEWELPNGNIVNADTLRFNLEVVDAGQYRARSLSNGCPSEWSNPYFIDVADPRVGLSFANEFIFSCNNDDSGLEFCVEDNAGLTGETYQWYYQDEFLGETSSTCFQVSDPSIFAFGLNEISLRIEYNNCVVLFEETLLLEIENVRNIDVDAGAAQLYCVGEELIMNGDEVNTNRLSAFWSGDENISIDDIRDPMATIVVLEDVDSTYAIWNVEHVECGVVFRDTVVLRQKVKPIPVTDTLATNDESVRISPLDNDILISGNNYEVAEVSDPRWGEASVDGNEIVFRADPKFIGGEIRFNYTVCDDACEILCDVGEVVIFYNAESCKGNNVLTPNNDGANDRFVIPCVENEELPESRLVIINEVGNTVFEQSPYDNSWDGTFNGEPLAEGTYYYIFRKDDDASVVQGFIAIER